MKGQVAVITGAAKGIGRGIAEVLLEKGAKVCLSDINADAGKETEKDLQKKFGAANVSFVKCDVTKEHELEALIKQARSTNGRLDIFVNNAGMIWESKFKQTLDLNLMGVVNGTMLVMKCMSKGNGGQGGQIINISSLAGLVPVDIIPHYVAIKHAVIGFTRALGMTSQKDHGVRINAICPGFVDTDLIRFKPEDLERGQLYGSGIEDKIKVAIDKYGGSVMTVRQVAERFLELAQNVNANGDVMIVSPAGCGLATKLPSNVTEALNLYVPKK